VSLIVLPSRRVRTRAAVGTLAAAIGDVLRAHPEDLDGSERQAGGATVACAQVSPVEERAAGCAD
jgi:hypothetical protein